MSTASHKPKLTGWAAAAAKAAPKPSIAFNTSATAPVNPTKQNKTKNVAGATPAKSHASHTASGPKRTKKPVSRPPFNSELVIGFLQANYTQHATSPNAVTYSRPTSQSSPDWGITTNNRWKSKKYACLNDVARSLKN
ncbi:LAME_0F07074g1_1 [Lachancea meyersii CBS 8951]|uniref:LAME_0F07074g1_1 n=1 Tax=Lachancea meyersii CBS 8951 TaxID=1266667 RepID=A0A1G4JU00_9SACH|nr:LAME_0F07074g1_1 [Lachancea meyersii CBS 8951]